MKKLVSVVGFFVLLSSAFAQESKSATQQRTTHVQSGVASYYSGYKKTANGERYSPSSLTAAHRTLPFNTKVKVTNTENGKSVVVRINNRGPFPDLIKGKNRKAINQRIIDLTPAAFEKIAPKRQGLAKVTIKPV